MSIKIQRKEGHGISYVRNALFVREFPPKETVFEIPALLWMAYLHTDFDLIEATDDFGHALNLDSIRQCCGGSLSKIGLAIKRENNIDRKINSVLDEIIHEVDNTLEIIK